jgi:hypothetical protein
LAWPDFTRNPNIIYAIIDNQANRPAKKKEEESSSDEGKMGDITKRPARSPDGLLNDYLDEENFPRKMQRQTTQEED